MIVDAMYNAKIQYAWRKKGYRYHLYQVLAIGGSLFWGISCICGSNVEYSLTF